MTTVDNHEVSSPSGKNEGSEEKGFFNRPIAGGKSIWDWMDFLVKLAIPLVVAGATIGLGLWQVHLADLQHQSDQQRALDQQQATILQTYIDNIQDLLLHDNLLKFSSICCPASPDPNNPYYDVAILAQARTLTALQGLDPHRKGVLLNFLYEARLIGFYNLDSNGNPYSGKNSDPIIYLGGADLREADLGATYLAPPGLCNNDACFEVHLGGAFLSGANLSGANLSGANLSGAWLQAASFDRTNISQQQLDQTDSCKDAGFPYGLTCHHQ